MGSKPKEFKRSRFNRRFWAALAILAALSFAFLQRSFVRPVEAVSSGIVISQVYGGGGNGGSTYKNDFIELFNRGTSPVDVTGWSVQYASAAATSAWQVTTLNSFTIQPGQYYLVQEAQGAGGTTNLPPPDTTGTIAMSATSANIALVNNTTALATGCPAAASVVDLVGYGSSACHETTSTAALTNTTADIRNNNGCTDTDNNSSDFTIGAPAPRNTASLISPCGGGGGPTITNSSPLPNGTVGAAYSVTFTASGGSGTGYTFAQTAGTLPPGLTLSGATLSGMPTTTTGSPFSFTIQVTDSASATGSKVFQLTVVNPSACPNPSPPPQSCGVERWSVKTGTDADVGLVNLNSATPTSIAALHALPSPDPTPANNRVAPGETTQWVINGTLLQYKLENDSDYHLVVQDGAGNTMVTEIPYPGSTPACTSSGSPFYAGMASARCTFDGKFQATTSFQSTNTPIRITGVGMFDFPHGQTGASPNQIEIHPILDIAFPAVANAATGTGSNVNVPVGDASLTFSNVSVSGTTTSTPIDPSAAGTAPVGYVLTGPARDFSTTATFTGPVNICFSVPYITDSVAFHKLKVLHNEAGVLVDRTTGQNIATKVICGSLPSLSPVVVAVGSSPTAAPGLISGRVTDDDGAPLEGVTMLLSGFKSARTITDNNGVYAFSDIPTVGFYSVRPLRANFSFNPTERSFSQISNNTQAVFAGMPTGANENPLDTPEYFVRQHYLDFLGREPDESGFNFWSDQIRSCGSDTACVERRTINVSAAYFLSIEFQETGGLVDGLYRASYGRAPLFSEFMPDTRTIARDVVVGNGDWEGKLTANKQAFVAAWADRAAFRAAYDHLSNDRYVGELINHTGVSFSQSERDVLVNGLAGGTLSRADVLLRIVEDQRFLSAKRNETFVLMEYFGYLRRDPDAGGYAFWLNKLSEFQGNFENAEMVKAFINSGEYRARFPR